MKEFPYGKKTFAIRVHPNKKKTQVISFEPFVLDIAAVAENNKANLEIIKFFKKKFGINVRIKMGLTSKNKLVEIVNPRT